MSLNRQSLLIWPQYNIFECKLSLYWQFSNTLQSHNIFLFIFVFWVWQHLSHSLMASWQLWCDYVAILWTTFTHKMCRYLHEMCWYFSFEHSTNEIIIHTNNLLFINYKDIYSRKINAIVWNRYLKCVKLLIFHRKL